MQIQQINECRLSAAALLGLGVSLAGAAATTGGLAADHMAAAAALCGPTTDHCGLCVLAGTLLVAALGGTGSGIWLLWKMRPLLPGQA